MTSTTRPVPSTSATKTATAISLPSTNACGPSAQSMIKMMINAKGKTTSIKAVGPLALPGAVTQMSSTPKMPMP